MKNTVHNDATSSNLKGKPMTKTIGLRWLQQVTKHVPATDEASVHRAQPRVKSLYYLSREWSPSGAIYHSLNIAAYVDYTSLPHYGAQDDDDDEYPNNTCQKSLESLFETLTTPSKDSDTHDISRFENNTLTYLSPATTRLHKELCGNSYAKIGGRSTMSLRTSRKSMLENIDWMI